MFEGQVETSERINLIYVDTTRHYDVLGRLTGAMAKRFVCRRVAKAVVQAQRIHMTTHIAMDGESSMCAGRGSNPVR
jgi:hypothetical protein